MTPGATVPFSEYLRLSLRHRPLIWLAPLAAFGAATGMFWAMSIADRSGQAPVREDFIFLLPLLPVPALLWGVWAWRSKKPSLSLLCLGMVLACVLCCRAARRTLPPGDDLSLLVKRIHPDDGALKPVSLQLRGYIADDPRRSEWSCEFPFQVAEATQDVRAHAGSGTLWLVLPPMPEMQERLGHTLQVGDALEVQAALINLPGPTNAGERDGHLRFALQNCWAAGRVSDSQDVQLWNQPPKFPLQRAINTLRRRLLTHYQRAFLQLDKPYPHATAQLLTAMAFGEGGLIEPLPRQFRDEFRAAGMSHILVASGTQISFICLIILGGARVLGARRWYLLIVLLPALLCYGALAGGAASIWRAAIAGVCISLALLQGRDVDALSLWSLALLVLVWLDPGQIFDIGFQLSFAATWGLIVAGPVIRRIVTASLGGNMLTELAAFSLAAQAGVTPVVAYHFGEISVSGLSANLLGVPLAGVLVGSAVLDLIVSWQPIHWFNYSLAQLISSLAANAAHSPGAQLEGAPMRLLWTWICYGLFAISLLAAAAPPDSPLRSHTRLRDDYLIPLYDDLRRTLKRTRWGRLQTMLAFALLLGAFYSGWLWWKDAYRPLRLTMLDVGQGESLVLQTPSGRTILIDGGGVAKFKREDVGRTVIVPFLKSNGIRRLDAVVLTHADADHCNGLPEVAREVPIGMVLDGGTGAEVQDVEYTRFQQVLAQRKVPVTPARAGQSFDLGEGVEVFVLAPTAPRLTGESADNDNAAVLKIQYGSTSLLLTADIEREAEERLIARGTDLKCTVLKVAHHGSDSSTGAAFLQAASPQVALISCGRYNRYGHPRREVLSRLANRQISTFRTDVNGALEVECNREACWVQSSR